MARKNSNSALAGLLIIAVAVCGICGRCGGTSEIDSATKPATFNAAPAATPPPPRPLLGNTATPANKILKSDRRDKSGAIDSSSDSTDTYLTPKTKRRAPDAEIDRSGATAKCRDGTLSYSAHRRGTCSHHGGVAVWY